MRSAGWLAALVLLLPVLIVALSFAGVYSLNRSAVRSELEPRRQELEALLASLQDELHASG